MDDDDGEDDELEAEDGYENFIKEKDNYREDTGPSARDIEDRRRREEML